MNKCPHCQRSEQQVKAGFNKSGSQRYKCHVCRRKYTPEPNIPGYPEAVRRKAIALYVDGMNFRRIGRVLAISHQTVANWVKAYVDQLPDTPPAPEGILEVNEMDELFTFVGAKKNVSTSSPR